MGPSGGDRKFKQIINVKKRIEAVSLIMLTMGEVYKPPLCHSLDIFPQFSLNPVKL